MVKEFPAVLLTLVLAAGIFQGCVNYIEEERTNPYDIAFDDGIFRIALSAPEKQENGQYKISWENVFPTNNFYITESSFSMSDFIVSAGNLKTVNRAPLDTEITSIRKQQTLPGAYSNLSALSKSGDTFRNSITVNTITGTNTYVIELVYTYKGKAGVLHSNVVVFSP